MELRDYLKIISKRIWLLVGTVIVVAIGTYWFTAIQPITYDASSFVNVVVKQPTNQGSTQYFQYDNYYSIQSSSFFTDAIIAWLQDPSNVDSIYNSAQIAKPDVKLSNLSKLIKATKKPPFSVQISFSNKDQVAAEDLVKSTVNFVKDKSATWTKEGVVKDIYVENSQPLVVIHKPSVILNTVVGIVVGIFLGLAIVFLVDYLKREE